MLIGLILTADRSSNSTELKWIRIAEKPGFMKVLAVKVCAKAEIGRKVDHQKNVLLSKVLQSSRFCQFFGEITVTDSFL